MTPITTETPTWKPYELDPAELVTVVNVLANGCKRGAFNIEEYELLTPLHRRLLTHLVKHRAVIEAETKAADAPTSDATTEPVEPKEEPEVPVKSKKKRKRS